MKCDVSGTSTRPRVARSRSGRLLSVLDLGQRQQTGRMHALDTVHSPTKILADHKSKELAVSPAELDGGESGKAALAKEEQDSKKIGPIASYQRDDKSPSLWERPMGCRDDFQFTTPSPTLATPRPTAWHSTRRSGPPPPILIAPPEISRTNASNNTYSSYQTSSPPYDGYNTINAPSPLTSNDTFMPDSASSSHSLQSARSYRSTEPLHVPATPRSPRSISDVSRRDSGTHVETPTLLPPTPTYSPSFSQSRRIPIDTVNFVCLGPLPDSIPLPSPRQFQEQKLQQQQQQQQQQQAAAAQSSRAVSPEQLQRRSRDLTVPQPQQQPLSTSPGRSSPTTIHDVVLHETHGLRPQPSPASSIFREQSLRGHVGHIDDESNYGTYEEINRFGGLRRQSTDSLGSNFTVEEEERIQAQIAKNLAMLGQERVVGTTDIVHIPQYPEKRYSWEEV